MSLLNRTFLFISIVLLIGLAALWIAGGKREQLSRTVEIDAHPSKIFPYLIEPEKLKLWVENLSYIDQPQPLRENAVAPSLVRVYSTTSGGEFEFADEVIRYSEPEILSIRSQRGGLSQLFFHQLDWNESLNKTEFTYSIQETNQWLDRLLAPLSPSKIDERLDAELARLKQLVEQNEPSGEPIKDDDE